MTTGRTARALLAWTVMSGLAISAAAQISDARAPSPKIRAKLIARIDASLQKDAYAYGVDFGDWTDRVAAEREALAQAPTAGGFTRALNRVLAGYGISHLFVVDPELASLRKAGAEIGAGFRTVPHPTSEGRLVNIVIPEGPADRGGVIRGDVVVAVDGATITKDNVDASFSSGGRLLGREDTRRRLTLERDGTRREVAVGFERHRAALPMTLTWPRPDTAWITVNTFTQAGYDGDAIERFFREIAEREARALVLDLRGNGGGSVTNTEHLASFLVPPETVLSRVFRSDPGVPVGGSLAEAGEEERLTLDQGDLRFDGALAILIDQGSGSGGDAFPGTMQQARGALLVGERTAGKLIGGTVHDLVKGYLLVYPIQERLLPDGTRVEGVGVQPEIRLGAVDTLDDAHILAVTLEALDARHAP